VAHHCTPNPCRVEILPGRVEQVLRRGGTQARNEALAHHRTLGIAAVRIEPETDDLLSVPDHVGHDGDDAAGHLAEVDEGVPDLGPDRDGLLTDVDDAHTAFQAACRYGTLAAGDDPRNPLEIRKPNVHFQSVGYRYGLAACSA